MPQRSIRFADELHAAIDAEAARRGRPHTFSSVLVEWAAIGRAASVVYADPIAAAASWVSDAAMHDALAGSLPLDPASTRTPAAEPDLMKALKASLDASPRRHAANCKCATCKPPKGTKT